LKRRAAAAHLEILSSLDLIAFQIQNVYRRKIEPKICQLQLVAKEGQGD
jgi:hypothetical protein